jgi:hypothetical protein
MTVLLGVSSLSEWVFNSVSDTTDWLIFLALGVIVTAWVVWLSATAYALFNG